MAKARSNKTKSSPVKRTRYKNDLFLKTLGEHCRRLRLQRGYSIDRLSKEGDQLSPASIDRLEKGQADSQILVLQRYADTLGLNILDLFAFLKESPDLSKDSRVIPYEEGSKAPLGYVPLYPLKVAAGRFSQGIDHTELPPVGWVDARLKGNTEDHFASFVTGESMEPKIEDGALCLFRRYTGGTRQNRIFLVQARGLKSHETGESFVVKKYLRQTPRRESDEDPSSVVHLISENPRFPPIVLVGLNDEEIETIAEFVRVL